MHTKTMKIMRQDFCTAFVFAAVACAFGANAGAQALVQWPLEGAVGAQPTGDSLEVVVMPAGNAPLVTKCRDGKVYEQGVWSRNTLVAVRLSGVEKTAGETFATGNALKVPANSFSPILGDFTMEGYFKFDKAAWESKYAKAGETARYVGLFRQDWPQDETRRVWQVVLQQTDDGTYRPRVGANGTTGAAMAEETFGNAVKTDGQWHHYAVTYDNARHTFEFFEDGISLGTHVFSGAIGLNKQPTAGNTAYYVGAATGTHPFEGLVDEVRLSSKRLAPDEFIKINDELGALVLFW